MQYVDSKNERGDTLIEALIALSVLAIISVGSFSLMSRGVAQTYDSMERAQVRMLMNSQAEVLNYMRDEYIKSEKAGTGQAVQYNPAVAKAWSDSIRNTTTTLSEAPSLSNCTPTNAFWVIDSKGGNIGYNSAGIEGISGEFPSPGDGIWIQKVVNNTGPQHYIDFFIRACWRQNSNAQTQVLSTVVRLYDL